MSQERKERDGFFDFYGISEEEEAFFRKIYRRRVIYRLAIAVLVIALAVLLWMR